MNITICLSCPDCGSTTWVLAEDGSYRCTECGLVCTLEDMDNKNIPSAEEAE